MHNRDGVTTPCHSFEAQLLCNPKGRFIRLVEFLSDGRASIPEGYRRSGWSLFEHQFLLFLGHMITAALSMPTAKAFPQLGLLQGSHPTPEPICNPPNLIPS